LGKAFAVATDATRACYSIARINNIYMLGTSSLSFPKSRRLTRASEFEHVKQHGYAERGRLMTLSVLAMKNTGPCRAGFITTRAIGSATIRNRIRRWLREIVRKHQHDLREDLWMVIIARRDAANTSYRALEDEWLRLAKRASILAL